MSSASLPAPHHPTMRALAAETRAVETGRHTTIDTDGSISVVSDTLPGVRYRVAFSGYAPFPIRFWCSCKSGQTRSGGQPTCWHMGLAARRLEREGLAEWDAGVWRSLLASPVVDDDPFDGLAGGPR